MSGDQTEHATRPNSHGSAGVMSSPPAPEAAPASPETPSPQEYSRILLIAAALGVPAAFAAAIFLSLIHGVTLLTWTTIPDAFGWTSPAAWYVVAVPTLAGALVAAVLQLPGHGGESPVSGPALEPLSPLQAISALLAALISLGGGIVLGPEVPLIVLGTTTGLVASGLLKSGASGGQILVIAGAFATISTIFGGPLVSALMILELLAFTGKVPSMSLIPVILPGFVASGTAALVFTGIDRWPGVHLSKLSLPALPNYPTVRIADIGWCVVVAVAVAILVAGARSASRRGAVQAVTIPPVVLLCGGGLAVGLMAVIFRAVTSQSVNLVLFSGENALTPVVAESSAGVLLLLIICKGAGYILSLGTGFRGGPTFPACTLGVAMGVLASLILPGFDLTPAVIAGVAAGASAALDLGIFGALLAAFLAGAAISAEALPIAVFASVIGWLVATAMKTRGTSRRPNPEVVAARP